MLRVVTKFDTVACFGFDTLHGTHVLINNGQGIRVPSRHIIEIILYKTINYRILAVFSSIVSNSKKPFLVKAG